jgi:hypothetical protein
VTELSVYVLVRLELLCGPNWFALKTSKCMG